MPIFLRATALAAGIAVAGASLGQSARAASATLVEQRILTQEGLAIALASTVLQSQLDILLYGAFLKTRKCSKLRSDGSLKVNSAKDAGKNEIVAQVTVFFDTACAAPYIKAKADIISKKTSGGGVTYAISETADYFGLKGGEIGVMSINEDAAFLNGGEQLTGLGTFVPKRGGVPVKLGLECAIPAGKNGKVPPFVCEGGIAQDFPKLHLSLASVTPITLTIDENSANYPVSFAAAKSDMVTGALGALSIAAPKANELAIDGKAEPYGSNQVVGKAGAFALFPPTPTLWALTDEKHDAKLSIQVQNDKARNSIGRINSLSKGTTLATFAVDQSGSGSITYSDKSRAPITSWLLAD